MIRLACAAGFVAAVLSGCAMGERDDDDAGEVEVSIDQLPADVRATLERESAGGTIQQIDRETGGGRTLYSADVLRGGEKWEIEIAEDGTLISSGPDEEDDDEDDDNDGED